MNAHVLTLKASASAAAVDASDFDLSMATIVACAAQWDAAKNRAEAAMEATNEAAIEAQALYPVPPPEIVRPDGFVHTEEELRRRDEHARTLTSRPMPGNPRLEAYDHWAKQCAALDRAFDVPRLNHIENRAYADLRQITERVLSLRPRDVAEAAIKLKVMIFENREGDHGLEFAAPFEALQQELEALAHAA